MTPYFEDSRYGITIYHGRCEDLLPQLPKADLLLVDPPYQQSNSGAGLVGRRATYSEIRLNLSSFDPAWLCGSLASICKVPHGYIFSAKASQLL